MDPRELSSVSVQDEICGLNNYLKKEFSMNYTKGRNKF
jgi:hypothetical protein